MERRGMCAVWQDQKWCSPTGAGGEGRLAAPAMAEHRLREAGGRNCHLVIEMRLGMDFQQ